MKFEWLVIVALFAWVIETLAHRWIWNQIPTQISPVTVYLILGTVLGFIAFRVHRLRTARYRRR